MSESERRSALLPADDHDERVATIHQRLLNTDADVPFYGEDVKWLLSECRRLEHALFAIGVHAHEPEEVNRIIDSTLGVEAYVQRS